MAATTQQWRLPAPLAREAVATVDGGVVVAGGLVQGDLSTPDSYRISFSGRRVSTLPRLVVPVHDAAGVSSGGMPTVVGGGNSTEQDAVQTLGRAGRWQLTRALPGPRADLVAVDIGQRLVVLGGYDGAREVAGILASRGGRRFAQIGRLAVPVRYPAVVVWRGDVWVLGGERHGHMVRAVQRVDVRTGTCRVVGQLPSPLGHAAAVVIGGRMLVMGGRTGPDVVTSAMEWFDPGGGSSRPAGHLPYPLADAGLAATPKGAYLLGGETPQLTDRVVLVSAH